VADLTAPAGAPVAAAGALVEQVVVEAGFLASSAAAADVAGGVVAEMAAVSAAKAAADATAAAVAEVVVAAWVAVCGQVVDCLDGCCVAAVLLLLGLGLPRAWQLLAGPAASVLTGLHPELPAGCPSLLQSGGTQQQPYGNCSGINNNVRLMSQTIALYDA
jgi:hypothetical protein